MNSGYLMFGLHDVHTSLHVLLWIRTWVRRLSGRFSSMILRSLRACDALDDVRIPRSSCVKLAYEHAQRIIDGDFTASDGEDPIPMPLQEPHTWKEVRRSGGLLANGGGSKRRSS